MARKPMQDIVPRDGRSIRNVPIPETRPRIIVPKPPKEPEIVVRKPKVTKVEQKEEPSTFLKYEQESQEPEVSEEKPSRVILDEGESTRPRIKRKTIGLIGAIVLVLALAVGVSTFFHKATLTLTPRTTSTTVQGEFTAKKTAGLGDLPFQVITIKKTLGETVKATGEKQVDKKATGTIIIYNNYSSASQRLVKNTRFATPEGLIFRITDSVTVPGKKGTTPGSVEAVVTADEPGASYNVGLKDFTIPGFKGDPRYSGFYARSKTSLAGGFSGIQKVVADADRAKAKANIEAKLTSELLREAPGQIPNSSITFEKARKIEFTTLPEENVGASEVRIQEEGVLSLIVFDKQKLSATVAKKDIDDYANEPILITNMEELAFTPSSEIKPTAETLTFSLSGNAEFEWVFDELSLKQALVEKSRGEIPSVLQKFPTIEKADISIRPFWLRKFPDTLDRITIEKEN